MHNSEELSRILERRKNRQGSTGASDAVSDGRTAAIVEHSVGMRDSSGLSALKKVSYSCSPTSWHGVSSGSKGPIEILLNETANAKIALTDTTVHSGTHSSAKGICVDETKFHLGINKIDRHGVPRIFPLAIAQEKEPHRFQYAVHDLKDRFRVSDNVQSNPQNIREATILLSKQERRPDNKSALAPETTSTISQEHDAKIKYEDADQEREEVEEMNECFEEHEEELSEINPDENPPKGKFQVSVVELDDGDHAHGINKSADPVPEKSKSSTLLAQADALSIEENRVHCGNVQDTKRIPASHIQYEDKPDTTKLVETQRHTIVHLRGRIESLEKEIFYFKSRQGPAKSKKASFKTEINLLKNGAVFLKYGRRGKPKPRVVWLTDDMKYIRWRPIQTENVPVTRKRYIEVKNIVDVISGAASEVFNRSKHAHDLSAFSILVKNGERTLDLEVQHADYDSRQGIEINERERDRWVHAFEVLIVGHGIKKPKSFDPVIGATKSRRVSDIIHPMQRVGQQSLYSE